MTGLGSQLNFDNFAINTAACSDMGACPFMLGDINEDGTTDLLDIQGFVAILTGGTPLCQSDINGDNATDLLDIAPFVDILTGG